MVELEIHKCKLNMISPYLAKMHLNSNKNLLNLSVLHTFWSSYSPLPHLCNTNKTLQLLNLLAAHWPKFKTTRKQFDKKFKWKLTNLVIWFIATKGSVFIDLGLIKKYRFNVFEQVMAGRNMIHFICERNAYIDLERLVKALDVAYQDCSIHKLYGDKLQGKN